MGIIFLKVKRLVLSKSVNKPLVMVSTSDVASGLQDAWGPTRQRLSPSTPGGAAGAETRPRPLHIVKQLYTGEDQGRARGGDIPLAVAPQGRTRC